MPRKHPRGGGGPVTPTPPPPASPVGVLGYARVYLAAQGLSGGSISLDDIHTPHPDARIFPCTTYSQLRTALLSDVQPRFIKVMGSDQLSGAGDVLTIRNPHFTVSGLLYSGGGVKDHSWVQKCGDAIWSEMKLASGEGATSAKSNDRAGALKLNPGNGTGDVLHGVCFDHMTGAWGPDVIMGILNNSEDITDQFCLWGPALLASNITSSPNGYGVNRTTPGNSNPATNYGKRQTTYQSLYALDKQRNLKAEHVLGYDAVNAVVFDYGNQAPVKGNFRAGNIMGCMFKKGPETQSSDEAFEEDTNYAQYADSVYQNGNIGITAAGGSFTLDWSQIDSAALRASVYDGGPTDADHGALTVATANGTLLSAVVAAAGRTYQDTVDAAVKAHVLAGTSPGYYNGAGYAAPHPSWS